MFSSCRGKDKGFLPCFICIILTGAAPKPIQRAIRDDAQLFSLEKNTHSYIASNLYKPPPWGQLAYWEEQHKTRLLLEFSLNALGSRHFPLCTPHSITAQSNKDFCHCESFSSSELLSLLLIRLPTPLSVNELMWTLYFQCVKTKRAIAQLQRWRGWCSVFKVRGGCLKRTETDLGSFPWNKEVKAEPLYPTSLTFILRCLKTWEGRGQGRDGRREGGKGWGGQSSYL